MLAQGHSVLFLQQERLWAVSTPDWCSQPGLWRHHIRLVEAASWAHLELSEAVGVVSLQGQGRADQISSQHCRDTRCVQHRVQQSVQETDAGAGLAAKMPQLLISHGGPCSNLLPASHEGNIKRSHTGDDSPGQGGRSCHQGTEGPRPPPGARRSGGSPPQRPSESPAHPNTFIS